MQQSADKLMEAIHRDSATHGALATWMYSDPGLTWHVLRRVQELRPDRLEVIELMPEQALSLLGLGPFAALIGGLPKVAAADQSESARLLRLLARRGHLAAGLCRNFAKHRHGPNVNMLFLGALLHCMGEWMLVELGLGELVESMDKSADPDEVMVRRLGFGLDRWITHLADQWGLPSLLRSEYTPSPSLYIARFGVQISNRLAQAAQQGWSPAAMENYGATAGFFLHKDTEVLLADVRRLSVETARESVDIGLPPAASALPSQGVTTMGALHAAAAVPESKTPPAAAGSPPPPADITLSLELETPPPPRRTRLLLPNTAFYSKVMQGLGATARNGVAGVLEQVVDGLHRGLGLHRTAFAARSRHVEELGVRFLRAWEEPCALNGATLPMDPPNLISKLMERTQSLWVREDNRARLFAALPAELRRIAGDEEFFLMTLVLNNRPIGLFYADRYKGHLPLDQQAYDGFRRLCTEAAKSLERMASKPAAR